MSASPAQNHLTAAAARKLLSLLGVLAWLTAAGCTSFTPNSFPIVAAHKNWSWPWSGPAREPVVPDRIMAVWSDTILHQPGEPGVRGFGGRVFFYEGDKKDPVEVDGGLAVYVFDADQADPKSPAPERKFVFSADQFASHMSHSELGCSYSVWLPWDEVGGLSRRLSIVVRFEGRHGGVVISQPTLKLLPGAPHSVVISKPTADSEAASDNSHDSGVRRVGYDRPTEQSVDRPTDKTDETSRRNAEPRRGPHTIDLPPSFYQRNLRAASSEPLPQRQQGLDQQVFVAGAPPMPATIDSSEGNRRADPSADVIHRESIESPTSDRSSPAERGLIAVDPQWERVPRGYPSRSSSPTVMKPRTLRREPFRAGWVESLPPTPRR